MNGLLDCLGNHVYLSACLATLVVLAAVLGAIRSAWRRMALVCGVLSTPLSLMALFLAPEYWQPKGIVQTPVLIEDVLFMFNVGAMAWLSGSWVYRERLILGRVRRGPFLLRGAVLAGATLGAGACLHYSGVSIGFSIPAVWLACVIVLARLRPDLRAMMGAAAARFGVAYFALAACVFAAAPGFAASWNHANLLGWGVLGVPIDEILWATGFGAVWPAFLVYATEGRILPCAAAEARPPAANRRMERCGAEGR
jgi:hypothetical protein